MRKLRFLLVLFALLSLTSCHDKAIFTYEIVSENPEECYNAELIFGEYSSYRKNDLFKNENKPYRRVAKPSRAHILNNFLIASDEILSNEIMYNITMPEEYCSLSISDLKKTSLSKKDYKKLCDDFVKNTSINADTTYKASYRLVISDDEKYAKAKNINQMIELTPDEPVFLNGSYYQKLTKQSDTIDDFVQSVRMLTNNLRTFHHIPVLHEEYSIFTVTRILIKPEFYSEPKSLEDVETMLSEYGLGLEPTGEEIKVVTFVPEIPVRDFLLYECGYFKMEFWMSLIFSLLCGICIVLNFELPKGCVTKDDFKRVLVLRSERTEEEKKKLRLYSIPFFCLSLLLFVIVVTGFIKPEDSVFRKPGFIYDASIFIDLSIMLLSVGIGILRYCRSYYERKGKILRNSGIVLDTLCLISLPIYLEGSGSGGLFFVALFVCLIGGEIIVSKMKKCKIIKPEEKED